MSLNFANYHQFIVKFTFAATTSVLLASCANQDNSQNNSHSPSHSISPIVAQANARYCSQDSQNVKLDLTGVELRRVAGIPLAYQGFNNIEGPVWHDGALYYSNMGSRVNSETGFELSNQTTIWRFAPGNKPEVWLDDTVAGTNGLAIDAKGRLIAARQLDGSVSSIDWQTKAITPIVSSFNGKRFNSPNDLTIGADGSIYFTDPNWNTPSNINLDDTQGGGAPGSTEPGQRIYRISGDGSFGETRATDLVPELADKPNGIMLSFDEQQLIIGGLQGLWVFDLKEDKLTNPKKLLNTPIDGLGKDCSGNIYVTTTRALLERKEERKEERKDGQVIVVLDKSYQEVGQLTVPGIHIVTNVAFGGNDGKTLFVTSLTAPMDGDKVRLCGDKPCLKAGIYTAKMNVQGFPY